MPYSRTQAKIDAFSRMKDLRVPFRYAKVRTRKLPRAVRDSVFQNCVFQLSALFEDYLSQVISGWFARLQTGGANAAQLPVSTRAALLIKHQEEAVRLYIGGNDEKRFGEFLVAGRGMFSILDDASVLPSIDLAPLALSNRKFPSKRNFEPLFRRLGMEKMLGQVSAKTQSNFDLNLQSFMDVRNALAHESPPNVTDVDVERYFNQVSSWIDAVDRLFYSHVVKVSGPAYW